MAWFGNPIIWLVIFSVLVVISVLLFGVINFGKKIPNDFKPIVAGSVAQIPVQSIVKFITDMNPDQVRALVIIDKNTHENKKGQMKRAMELYSLLDQRIFPEMYNKIFKTAGGKSANVDDIGGILLAHYDTHRKLEIYTMSATENGEAISVNDQQFSSKQQAADALRYFYTRLQHLTDHLVVVISGPNITDLDQINHDFPGETILEPEESFGMYSSALESWLAHHPSASSITHYNRRKKQQIHDINTFTTNQQGTQRFNPAVNKYIRF